MALDDGLLGEAGSSKQQQRTRTSNQAITAEPTDNPSISSGSFPYSSTVFLPETVNEP